MGRLPKTYEDIISKTVCEILDKFPDAPTFQLARILHRDNPLIFKDIEQARTFIRYKRGLHGSKNRKTLKDKKYVRQSI